MKKITFMFLVLLMAVQLTACSSEASKALREANKAFENENWTDAQVAANQVILNYPGTKEAEKAAKLVEEAGKKLDYEEAEDLVTQAEKAYSENQWKVVINSFSKIEKLAPESDLVDRAAKWNDDAKANWIRELSSNISQRAIYEDRKIRLYIPDRNLYLEIKNSVETSGGYVEMQLSPNLLQIRPEYFIDLVLAISDDDDRKKASEEIKKRAKEKDKTIEFMERKSFGQQLGGFAPKIIADLLSNIPGVGPLVGTLFKNVCKAIIG